MKYYFKFICILVLIIFHSIQIYAVREADGQDDEGFSYRVNLDTKEATLFAFYNWNTFYCSTSAHWNIPEYVDIKYYGKNPTTNTEGWFTENFRITEIGYIEGSGIINVESITLPNSIKAIGRISLCPNLKNINIPSSVKTVGEIFDCASLKSLTLPNGVVSFGGCMQCENLEEITLSNSIETLGRINNCPKIQQITLPSNLINIVDNAFIGCTSLFSITIKNSVTSIGKEAFRGLENLHSINIGSGLKSIGSLALAECPSIKEIVLPNGLDNIGDAAFSNSGLTKIKIPGSVTVIGQQAFENCTSLNSVDIESGNSSMIIKPYAFRGCSLIDSLIIPARVSFIADNAFQNCINLSNLSVEEGNGNMTIGRYAFSGCGNLKAVSLATCVNVIENYAFSNCGNIESIEMGGHVKRIGDYAFQNCGELKYAIISADTIGNNAFSGCVNLQTLSFSDNLVSIGTKAFWECNSLQNLNLPDKLETIGREAFYGCGQLQNLRLGSTIQEISIFAFSGCSKLQELIIPDNVVKICGGAFEGCAGLQTLTIGNHVSAIEESAFTGCVSLTQLVLPNSLQTIGKAAFKNCNALQMLTLGSNLVEIGIEAFFGCKILEELAVPDMVSTISSSAFYDCNSLKTLAVGNNVQEICDNAFYGCSILDSLSLGSKLERIGKSSFYGCNKLSRLTISGNVTAIGAAAFYGCQSMTKLTIDDGNSGLSIGAGAFRDCQNLETLQLGNRVTEIKNEAFWNCPKLESLSIGPTVKTIGYKSFEGCANLETLTFSNGIQEIGNYAFNGCSKITDLVLPHSLTSIGEGAFCLCNSLENLVMGNHIKDIPYKAFSNCYKLKTINMSKDLEAINGNAFYGCNSLDSLEFGSKVKVIDGNAFYGCSNLKSLDLPNTLEVIGASSFQGASSLSSLIIPSCVTSIGNTAFSGCRSLTNLTIGGNVENIGDNAFNGCTILKSLDIPNSVNSIGQSAFYGCDSLLTLTLGSGLTEIGANAFYNCKSLDNIYCKPTLPPNVVQSAFNIKERYYDERYHYWTTRTVFNSHPTLFVPEAAENLYQEHEVWKLFLIKPQMKMVAFWNNTESETSNSRAMSSNSDVHIVSQDEIEVEGVTADGASMLFVYFNKEYDDIVNAQWIFKIDGKVIDKNDPRVGNCKLFLGRDRENNRKTGFVYTAPEEYLCNGNEYKLSIEFKAYNSNNVAVTSNAVIRILRPGVILLHGFGSNAKGCFDVLKKHLLRHGGYQDYQILNADYKNSNTASFDSNTHEHQVVGKSMKEICSMFLKNKIVASKFDLVGHSMGGILSRKYAQEVRPESVNRIITLDTPHYGSEFSSEKYELIRTSLLEHYYLLAPLDPIAEVIFGLLDIVSNTWDGLASFEDLKVNSKAIQKLNNSEYTEKAKGIPVHAIVSYMTPIEYEEYCNIQRIYSSSDSKELIVLEKVPVSNVPIGQCVGTHFFEPVESDITQYDILEKIFGGKNDGVVAMSSQLGGFAPNSNYVSKMESPFQGFYGVGSEAHHIKTHHWIKTLDKIQQLLHLRKNHEKFSKDGFVPLQSSTKINVPKVQLGQESLEFQEVKETSFIHLDVIKDETERVVVVHIDQSEDIIRNMVFAKVGKDEILIAMDSIDACFEIPETFNGELKVYALGRTNYNALVADIASTEFTNSAVLNKLFFEDNTSITINVGEQVERKVMGWWSNGEDIYLNPTYSTSTDGLLEMSGDTIKALSAGECMLKASYLGLSDSIHVTIIAPVTELEISQTSVTLEGGEAIKLEATVNEDASNKEIVWSSADSNIASVNSEGLVRGLRKGQTIITATSAANTNLTKECLVTVTSDAQGLMLPDVPFEFYYCAADFNETTKSIPNHENANLQGASLKLSGNIPTYVNGNLLRIEKRCEGYIDKWSKGATASGRYFYRSVQNNMTIVAKVAPSKWDAIDLVCNRGSGYNYMWRIGESVHFLHTATGYSEDRALPLNSSQPQVLAVRVNGMENYILLDNLTTGESKRVDGINWGGGNNVFKLFYNNSSEYFLGDFYWVYYSFELLSDEQISRFSNKIKHGDANGDGTVDVNDITATVNSIQGDPSTTFVREAADVNGDGIIDVNDITGIVNIIQNK